MEFCNEHDVWKLNVAHVLFMQVHDCTSFRFPQFFLSLPPTALCSHTLAFFVFLSLYFSTLASLNFIATLFLISLLSFYFTTLQEGKYREAIGFYEPIVRRNYDNLLSISAIVLANLCVSYIMTSQNDQVWIYTSHDRIPKGEVGPRKESEQVNEIYSMLIIYITKYFIVDNEGRRVDEEDREGRGKPGL